MDKKTRDRSTEIECVTFGQHIDEIEVPDSDD
jgi:hypothetical protein